MRSLQARLVLSASVTLLAFFGLSALALDAAFRNSTFAAAQERLQAQVYMLLGVTDVDASSRLIVPEALPESRLGAPLSGLYAGITDRKGEILWQSRSLLGRVAPVITHTSAPGEPQFHDDLESTDLLVLSFAVDWEYAVDQYKRLIFWVAEDRRAVEVQITRFRRTLGLGLIGASLLLVLVQGGILRWSLRPLRHARQQVDAIRRGERSELQGPFPRELQPLAVAMNELLVQRQQRLERYRNALGDLAHSLKTPLAVLDGALNHDNGEDLRHTLREQIGRMNRTVDYQLQRAAASGHGSLGSAVMLAPLVDKVLAALGKVYRDKGLRIEADVPRSVVVTGDEGDWYEIIGNLADNACKWASSGVDVRASVREGRLSVEVIDDGPGVSPEHRRRILERGARASAEVAGHGIGLAVVRDLVEDNYGGRLEITTSDKGGAKIRVSLRAGS